jgi:NAD-dependent DNA ligase
MFFVSPHNLINAFIYDDIKSTLSLDGGNVLLFDIAELDKMGKKSAENLINALEKSKENTLSKLITALGIRFIGEKASKLIAKYAKNMDILISLTKEELVSIDEIGDAMAQSVVDYFSEPQNLELIEKLRAAGVNFEEKTSRHILTEFLQKDNYLKMRNVYSINYGDVNVFMSASENITSAICDKILVKNISFNLNLDKNEEKEVVFVLGCSQSDLENKEL